MPEQLKRKVNLAMQADTLVGISEKTMQSPHVALWLRIPNAAASKRPSEIKGRWS